MSDASKRLLLENIRIDGDTQSRTKLDQDAVAEYAEAMRDGKAFPPIVVFFDGSHYWLADGFHRFFAAKEAGQKTIDADIRKGFVRDAVLFACGANADHGLKRTNADKRKAVETLLNDEEWAKWSDREIADRAGVSNRFVGDVRRQLCTVHSSTAAKVAAEPRVGKDGKARKTPAPKPAEPEEQDDQPSTGHSCEPDDDQLCTGHSSPAGSDQPSTVEGSGDTTPDPLAGKKKITGGLTFNVDEFTDELGPADEAPEALKPVFAEVARFKECLSQISKAKSLLKAILDGPASNLLTGGGGVRDLENAYQHVKFAMPHAPCPAKAKSHAQCKVCKGRGWVNEEVDKTFHKQEGAK